MIAPTLKFVTLYSLLALSHQASGRALPEDAVLSQREGYLDSGATGKILASLTLMDH